MKFTDKSLNILDGIAEMGVIFLTIVMWQVILEGAYTIGGDPGTIGTILLMVVVFSLTFKTAKYVYQVFKG